MNPAEATPRPPSAGTPRPRRSRPRAPWKALAAAAALAVAAGACAAPAPEEAGPLVPASGTAELTGQDLDAWLDEVVPGALDATGIPGAAVSVVRDGELLTARGFGDADTGADGGEPVPVDPGDTLFRAGSVSKLFTGTAVMQLVESGDVDLDTDVDDYIDFTLPTTFDEPVTLRHLLSHTAGFEEQLGGMMLAPGAEPDLRDRVAVDPPEQVYAPGTVPAYSNYGNALAGYVVEQVSGVPFEDYVQDNVLAPLDMDSSTFAQPLPAGLADRLANGYPDDAAPAGDFETVAGPPAGALTTSATDMARFMLAHLSARDGGRQVLSPETLELMHAPALEEGSLGTLAEGPRMTLGFFEEDRNGHRILGHGGDTPLFHSYLQIYPNEGTGIFVALNGSGNGPADNVRLRRDLLAGFADRYFPASGEDTAEVRPTAAEHAAAAAGTYETSRSMHSTFLSVLGLMQQTRVTALEDGTIRVAPYSATMESVVFEEVGPWVWREVDGQRILTMRAEDGRVEALGFESAFSLLRADPARDAAVAVPVLAASVVILLVSLVSLPIGAAVRRLRSRPARDRAGRVARILTRAGVAGLLAAVIGKVVVIAMASAFQPVSQDAVITFAALQWVGVLAIAPAAVALYGEIRRGSGWKRYLGGGLVLAALLGMAYIAVVFQMLTFDASF
ncbi:serine hydrolase domain-containing protein [Nocardiopsis sediminis]|uniref:Serine hydrolase domain-containing protein n=1 Tax=Nocardiopsis sediminis TaxID=1778267 RepID=A0ABV8FMP7_9ACTN